MHAGRDRSRGDAAQHRPHHLSLRLHEDGATPESVTEPEKRASLRSYGDHKPLHAYEYDHLVPLELGGARNDPRNLWPEPGAPPNPKDGLEYHLRTEVCDGQMKLAAAQLAIARDWVAAWNRARRP